MPCPKGFNITVFECGVGGIPSTTLVASLSGEIESYEHTISATFGFETMRCTLTTTAEDALDMLNNWLMRSVIVFSPDAEIVWEGFLETVEAQFGQERRSVSLSPMANRVKARYVTPNGVAGVSTTLNDTASQVLYGTKDLVVSIGTATSGEADDEATVRLAEVKNPRMTPSSDVQTGDLGPVQVTLIFSGWYAALDWLVTSNSTTSTAVTTAQVATLLTTAAATNAFISTSTADIVASGRNATQLITADTTIRSAIENLLKKGNGTNRYHWGVYEDRVFAADVWAGATPATAQYRRYLGAAQVYDSAGGAVDPWNVRPNRMIETVELLDVAPVSSAPDTAARYYVERVTCRIGSDGIGVSLEPAAYDNIDVRLARIADIWGGLNP